MQKRVGTKDNENESEKKTSDDGENFHGGDGKLIQAGIPISILRIGGVYRYDRVAERPRDFRGVSFTSSVSCLDCASEK